MKLCDKKSGFLVKGRSSFFLCAKWSNPVSKSQMPYNLTYKLNLMNKTNKQAK